MCAFSHSAVPRHPCGSVAFALCSGDAHACRVLMCTYLRMCLPVQCWQVRHAHEAPPLSGPGAMPTGPSHGGLNLNNIVRCGSDTYVPWAELRGALQPGAFPLVRVAFLWAGGWPAAWWRRRVLNGSPWPGS